MTSRVFFFGNNAETAICQWNADSANINLSNPSGPHSGDDFFHMYMRGFGVLLSHTFVLQPVTEQSEGTWVGDEEEPVWMDEKM